MSNLFVWECDQLRVCHPVFSHRVKIVEGASCWSDAVMCFVVVTLTEVSVWLPVLVAFCQKLGFAGVNIDVPTFTLLRSSGPTLKMLPQREFFAVFHLVPVTLTASW